MAAETRCTLQQARAAKGRALEVFAPLGKVVGVGLTRLDGGYGVKVNLEAAPPAGTRLPSAVDGVPVSVEVVGRITKQ